MDECPTCGSPVKIVGKTTLHYEPVTRPSKRVSEDEVAKIIETQMPIQRYRVGYGDGTDEILHQNKSIEVAKAIIALYEDKPVKKG